MVPIKIDISPVIQALSLDNDEIKSLSRFILDSASDRYMQLWEKRVDNTLHQTRNAYKLGMRYEYEDDFTVSFILDGKGASKLALMIEKGVSPFDQKEGFSRSTKKTEVLRKDGSVGWYLTIPMRHATAEAIGEASIFAGKLPQRIQQLSKKLGRALKTEDLPEEYQQLQTNVVGYEHKSPIYSGLVHNTKKNHEGYFTFRRVSDMSDILSWTHKGFEEHDLMGKSMEDLSQEIPEIVKLAKEQFLDMRD